MSDIVGVGRLRLELINFALFVYQFVDFCRRFVLYRYVHGLFVCLFVCRRKQICARFVQDDNCFVRRTEHFVCSFVCLFVCLFAVMGMCLCCSFRRTLCRRHLRQTASGNISGINYCATTCCPFRLDTIKHTHTRTRTHTHTDTSNRKNYQSLKVIT